MADQKDTVTIPQKDFQAIMDRLEVSETKLVALEGVVNAPVSESVTKGPAKKIALTGETFKVGGDKYQVKYPVIVHNNIKLSEADILGNKSLQEELVTGGFGVIKKVSAILLMLMFAFAPAQASTVTFNINTAEVVSTSFTKRDFYEIRDLLIIYKGSNEAFEVQTAETRTKVWGGDIDSVTISGASTAAAKLAFLRTLMLEATTTNGYRVFIGRSNLEFSYTAATTRLDIKYGRNKQPLWFGTIDSLQISGLSSASAKLAYLRGVHKWRAQDCLPTTSLATVAAGAAAGSSPTVSITGDAFSGTVNVTTGTSATTGVLATITLKITAPSGTRVKLEPKTALGTLHSIRAYATSTTTTLVINVPTTALSDATLYTWDYSVVPY